MDVGSGMERASEDAWEAPPPSEVGSDPEEGVLMTGPVWDDGVLPPGTSVVEG